VKKKNHHKRGRRNNGSGGGAAAAHPRPRSHTPRSHTPRSPRHGSAPNWKTVGAAIVGGAGGAALGGLIVNQKILSPEAVGLGLMLGGGATAYYGDGTTRVVGTSLAAAGAGQLALALMAKQAVKSAANQNAAAQSQATNQSGQPAAQLPAPPPAVEPPRRSATEGGIVLDLFRDAATDLETLDDEWRFGVHDELRDAAEPLVIDLDEVA
jgi:hypothetical protein